MKSRSRKIVSDVCVILGIALVLAAFALFFYNEKESTDSENEKNHVLEALQEKLREEMDEPKPETDKVSVSLSDEVQRTEMTEVVIDGYAYIGYLRFPSLDVEFPIMSGWDEKRLKIAPCRYYGSIYTNDLVIAGHNYRKGFGKLKQLSIGDTVEFVDMEGVLHSYIVDATEVLQPADIDAMVENPWDMSLYTCTYEGKQRLTIRLKKIQNVQ